MKKALIIPGLAVAALMSLPFNLSAQTPAKTGPDYDPKAKTILDGVSTTAKAYTSITCTFTMTMEDAKKNKTVKTGTAILKGSQYKISLDNKDAKGAVTKEEYYNDGKHTWVYSQKDKEVTKDVAPDPKKKKNENQISPTEIFTFYETGYKYKFVKEETQAGGKVVQIINLYPEQPDKKNFHTSIVTIDKVKKQIISVQMLNKDGSKTTYTVNTFTPNIAYTDATFQFDKKTHPGVTEIDLTEESDE